MEERYQTIAKELQAEIDTGIFVAGCPLPTRAKLAERFKVARATMDRAVTCLVKKGVLTARRGAGTEVASGAPLRTIGVIEGVWPWLSQILPPAPFGVQLERISSHELQTKAYRNTLRKYDGLIWICPEDRELAWARETPPNQPQLLVNRHISGFNYVSCDHRGAICDITSRRLAECPTALPVFLSVAQSEGLVWGMREKGFVDACRQADRFYEIIPLPNSFDERLLVLNAKLKATPKRPIILVSGSRINTGSVIAWVKSQGLTWRKEIFYSDFDNEYPPDIWGLTVSSFIQNMPVLFTEALSKALALINNTQTSATVLIPPTFINGDT